MLVPNIFANPGKKELNKGNMIVIHDDEPVNEGDNEIIIINLSGSGHSDNNIGHSPNWSMFKHISIDEKDGRKLMRELQKYFKKKDKRK